MSWFDVDSAFAEMEALGRQMDALLGNRGLDGRHGLRLLPWNADEGAFVADGEDLVWRTDLPGFTRDDVEVGVGNGLLTIDAKRGEPAAIDGSPKYRERRAVELHRSFTLPDRVDPEGIGATLEDGVLTVRLRQRPEAKPRRITVT